MSIRGGTESNPLKRVGSRGMNVRSPWCRSSTVDFQKRPVLTLEPVVHPVVRVRRWMDDAERFDRREVGPEAAPNGMIVETRACLLIRPSRATFEPIWHGGGRGDNSVARSLSQPPVHRSPAAARESCGLIRADSGRAYCGCFMRSFAPLFVPSLFAPFSMMTRL